MRVENQFITMDSPRLLLTSLGIRPEETVYQIGDGTTYGTHLFAEALVELLDVEFDVALITRTETIERSDSDHDLQLADRLEERGIEPIFLRVPEVTEQADVDTVLNDLVAEVRTLDPATVVLDVTHAFRSLQMVFFVSMTQLDALGEIRIDGIYYGYYRDEEDISPVIDLTYLHTLTEWYYALRSFREAGSFRPAHRLLEEQRERVFKRGEPDQALADMSDSLADVSTYLDSGLPLEGGSAARDAIAKLEQFDEEDFVGPQGVFREPLLKDLRVFASDQEVAATSKEDIELTMAELKREREIVRFYAEHEKYWHALECGRELFLNRVLFDSREIDRRGWLDEEHRRIASEELGRQLVQYRDGPPTEESPDVPRALQLWDRLTQYRNMNAHAGFKEDTAQVGDRVHQALEELCDHIEDDDFWTELDEGV